MSDFNWQMMMILIGVSLPGLLIALPRFLATIKKRLPAGRRLPSGPVMLIASFIQSLVLLAGSAVLGCVFAHRAGLDAPFFQALITSESAWEALRPQLFPTLYSGIAGALIFVAAYYLIFRPRLDTKTVSAMEGLRLEAGILSRIFYGGIVEEVLMRWGLMSFLVWLGSLVTGAATAVVVWTAIAISGLLFGLGHLPAYLAAGCNKTPAFFTTMIALNLGAAVIFGWLFWQYGLASAMAAHMLFHLVWYPFDIKFKQIEVYAIHRSEVEG